MNADERVETYDFGLNQAKHGLVLAKGEKIIDCFDYDTYRIRDKVNSCVTVENSVLLTNKRLVQMRFSDSKRRTEKRNTEIPVDRIECVNSYYKYARYLNPWLIAIFGILALAFLVFGILTAAISFSIFACVISFARSKAILFASVISAVKQSSFLLVI